MGQAVGDAFEHPCPAEVQSIQVGQLAIAGVGDFRRGEPIAFVLGELRQKGVEPIGEFFRRHHAAEEIRFATEIGKTLAEPRPVAQAAVIEPYGKTLGYGSTDVGDVSWATPTVGLETATWAPGTPAHSWQSAAASGTSLGFKGAQLAAKALTLMAVQLYTDPALRAAAKAEFDASRGPNYVYRSLLGDRKPPLDFRK